MLVRQGALAFDCWTNMGFVIEEIVPPMRTACERALQAQAGARAVARYLDKEQKRPFSGRVGMQESQNLPEEGHDEV
jgi:hypothetical protein